jgi:hypothetical protein
MTNPKALKGNILYGIKRLSKRSRIHNVGIKTELQREYVNIKAADH